MMDPPRDGTGLGQEADHDHHQEETSLLAGGSNDYSKYGIRDVPKYTTRTALGRVCEFI